MKKGIVIKRLLGAGSLCLLLAAAGCGAQGGAENGAAVSGESAAGEETADTGNAADTQDTQAAGTGAEKAADTEGAQGKDGSAGSEDTDASKDSADMQEGVRAETGRIPERQWKDAQGRLLLTVNEGSVQISIPQNPAAEEAVNGFFKNRKQAAQDMIAEYRQMAQEDLALLGEEEEALEYWMGYDLGWEYTVMRADEKMICIVEDSYEYTGGAHPNTVRCAYNFDTATGKQLSLEDIAKDLDTLRAESAAYMEERLQSPDYADYLVFDDYRQHLDDILTDATWYTDEEGFHIICNEYIITPHAAGIFEFTLPYEEPDIVKEEYRTE